MIVVTGGSGKLGRAVVKHLMDHGYPVTSVDMAPPPGQSNPPKPGDVVYSRADVTDFGQAMAALSMIDERVEKVTGVVHLAAIAAPGQAPNHVIFGVNTVSTYNVFEAARQLGIRNVVWASSETVYGIPYPKGPAYVPVDEAIVRPETAYSLSADGREDGRAVLPLGPGAEDRRPPLLERAGAGGLRPFRRLRRGRPLAEVQPLDLHRRP
jgi:nucleoside-diphosphate-sugar epimerase